MRKSLSIIMAVLGLAFTADLSAKKTKEIIETPASDSRIEYTGRTLVCGDEVSYDWSGVYFRIKFNGPYLAMKCSDTQNCWFNLWVDKEMTPKADKVFMVGAQDTLVVLAEGLDKGEHEVILQKRTEGEQGRFTVHSFLSEGQILQAKGRKERHIEFIGDSYTCGYGTESPDKNDPFLAETENCNLTYAAITARYFGADFNLVSHSGQGIARNYDNFGPGYYMPDRYLQTFDMDSTQANRWDATKSDFHPAMTVIYLGPNDFSVSLQPKYENYRDNYYRLIKSIKANYGEDHPVLCVAAKSYEYLGEYVRELAKNSGMKNVHYLVYCPTQHNHTNEDLGADVHPNYNGQQKKAFSIIPYIATITGWGLQDMPVK
jgi:lysophospholipase L1-like esterase